MAGKEVKRHMHPVIQTARPKSKMSFHIKNGVRFRSNLAGDAILPGHRAPRGGGTLYPRGESLQSTSKMITVL